MRAVAHVIMNRAKNSGLDPCYIVTRPKQFAKGMRRINDPAWQLAKRVSINPGRDLTRGATFFHSTSVNPRWKLKVTFRFGNHVFYKR